MKFYNCLIRSISPILWACLLCAVGPALASPNPRLPVMPGKLVDIGGHRLHIYCEGWGKPTVIFDSGAGGFSLEWMRVQKVLARRTRVCSYDRAGYGWSEVGPLPRSIDQITRELHELLNNAGEQGPYIMAGHSFGGYSAQLFARNYPDKIAGLVLIDSSHPEQAARFPKRNGERPRTIVPRSRNYIAFRHIMHPNFPKEVAPVANRLMNSWNHTMTWREEMMMFPSGAAQLMSSKPMPTTPVVVLTRGRRVWPNNAYGDQMERIWMDLQDELSRLSVKRVHLIAEHSGHQIHLDQPGIVIDALLTLLDSNFSDQ